MSVAEQAGALSPAQKLHLLASYQYADRLLSEIESILTASRSKSPFPKYRPDLTPAQAKVIEDYIARLRAQMLRVLDSLGVQPPEPQLGSLASIRVALGFVDIAFEECRPKRMRGYGQLPESRLAEMDGAVDELQSLVGRLDAYLAQGLGQDLAARLEQLERAGAELSLVRTLERIVREHGLVEFRPTLSAIIERLETRSFEIAVFGRVSSGKSSLLNHILQAPVLPVGVTPITAVPTRVLYGPRPLVRVWFAGARPEEFPLERLAEFVSEEFNPGNTKDVTRIVVELPAPRLRQGVIFVDTPGLGPLAGAGAAQTRAYLPECDLGVVLLDAASLLSPEDLAILQALYDAGIPAQLLLSKADLLEAHERQRVLTYLSQHIRGELGLDLPVYPVSVRPGHSVLLEAWFDREILPLYAQYRELSERSVRRKIGILKAGVRAALEARLRHAGRTAGAEDHSLRELEHALREVSGRFSEARTHCLRLTDETRHAGPQAIRRAAAALVAAWTESQAHVTPAAQALDSVVRQTAAEQAAAIARILESLAREATRVLRRTAEGLKLENAPDEDELTGALRELPRLDAGWPEFSLAPRRWILRISPRLERRRIERVLSARAGQHVAAAFTRYSRLLEAWVRREITELQARFDSYAETYRAQFDALAGGLSANPELLAALSADLKILTEHSQSGD